MSAFSVRRFAALLFKSAPRTTLASLVLMGFVALTEGAGLLLLLPLLALAGVTGGAPTAAMVVSARHNRRSRMTIGVKLGASEEFGAHAWLETPHGTPVGGDEAAQFAPLLSVDPYA